MLAEEFTNVNFLCTNVINSNLPNVLFTNNLTNRSEIGCDLPEIGYIAGYCDMIITNSSGPGTFAMTRKVFFDISKDVIAFVQGPGNTFWDGVPGTLADLSWHNVYDDVSVASIVKAKMLEKQYDKR